MNEWNVLSQKWNILVTLVTGIHNPGQHPPIILIRLVKLTGSWCIHPSSFPPTPSAALPELLYSGGVASGKVWANGFVLCIVYFQNVAGTNCFSRISCPTFNTFSKKVTGAFLCVSSLCSSQAWMSFLNGVFHSPITCKLGYSKLPIVVNASLNGGSSRYPVSHCLCPRCKLGLALASPCSWQKSLIDNVWLGWFPRMSYFILSTLSS